MIHVPVNTAASASGSATPTAPTVSPDALRNRFSSALSAMYRQEVPLYGDLIDLVTDVNHSVLSADLALANACNDNDDLHRLTVERHGAIRVGTPEEFQLLAKIFSLLGMSPVGFYDLSDNGLPIRATAFRPTTDAALRRNPFRVFTSLLQLELIPDEASRSLAREILAKRRIASPALEDLVDRVLNQQDGAMTERDADQFIPAAIEVFKWHSDTTVSKADYDRLREVHPLVADIVCFRGPHINHLTPRSLDIDAVQDGMGARGIDAKEVIEGPPRRQWPILLRQTSFKALSEPVYFVDPAAQGGRVFGHHTARFGEIESRGAAVTRKGLRWYQERLAAFNLAEGRRTPDEKQACKDAYQDRLRQFFVDFPDTLDALRTQGLVYLRFSVASSSSSSQGLTGSALVARLLQEGAIKCEPITYEDFLPASAAGIFSSNLESGRKDGSASPSSSPRASPPAADASAEEKQKRFEAQTGIRIQDVFELYEAMQDKSIAGVAAQVGVTVQEARSALLSL
ncbi:unnamed protein product [Parajaminaea phylloscopi]